MGRVVLFVALALAGAACVGAGVLLAGPSSRAPDAGAPIPLFEQRDDCDLPCFESAATLRFHVPAHAHAVDLVVFANLEDASGPARVSVIDPSGDLRYARTFAPTPARAATQDSATWSAEPGEWTLTRSYVGVSGSLTFDAWSTDALG